MGTTVLYAGIKNQFQRTSLSKKLVQIAEATKDASKGFLNLPVADVNKLLAADPSMIQVAPSQDGGKTQPVKATEAGLAAVADAAPIAERQHVVAPAGSFKIETGVELPTINRGGERTQMYPFDELEVGQSFFVPATETMPNPGKTLASAVSSATRRWKATPTPRVFTIRANVRQNASDPASPKGARVWRIAPEDATPAQAAGQDASASAPAAPAVATA